MVEKQLCTGCGACAAACPNGSITMRPDPDGFLYPHVQTDSCTTCGLCAQVCPLTRPAPPPEESACFGAKAKREQIRLLGSSGGIFPLLAAHVLREGGAVLGASLLPDGRVQHIEIHAPEDIPKVSRTKYVQSDLTPVWRMIGALTESDRPVLFCGTPCQTDALRAYLGGRRGGLILADLICYGVPSPGIWARYVSFLEKRYSGEFRSFFFRDKRGRDSGRTCALRIGETEYTHPLYRDPYCRTFFRNVNLRPSCFHCRYCTPARSSDITLGDFWGIEQLRPDFDDGLGCSAVICHTAAGRQLWEQVKHETHWFPCQQEDIANAAQPRLREPTKPHPLRTLLLSLQRYIPFPLWLRLFGPL